MSGLTLWVYVPHASAAPALAPPFLRSSPCAWPLQRGQQRRLARRRHLPRHQYEVGERADTCPTYTEDERRLQHASRGRADRQGKATYKWRGMGTTFVPPAVGSAPSSTPSAAPADDMVSKPTKSDKNRGIGNLRTSNTQVYCVSTKAHERRRH